MHCCKAKLFGLLSLALASSTLAIYPDDFWNYSTKVEFCYLLAMSCARLPKQAIVRVVLVQLTQENADEFVKTNVDAGKTVYVRWIASAG